MSGNSSSGRCRKDAVLTLERLIVVVELPVAVGVLLTGALVRALSTKEGVFVADDVRQLSVMLVVVHLKAAQIWETHLAGAT